MALPFSLFSKHRSCECGSHATGIYTFTVTEGTGDCCEGTTLANSVGFKKNYVQSGQAWEWTHDDTLNANSAQSICCPLT